MAINPKELGKRVLVGTIYVLITALSTLISWYSTVVIIALTAGLCCFEFLRMARNSGYHPYMFIGTAAATLMPISLIFVIHTPHLVVACLAVAFVAAILMLLRYFAHVEDTIVDVALTLFGYLYTGLTLSSFILVRSLMPDIQGGLLGFLVLTSIWANDGFAYLGGSAFGRHKFAPHISPKKSWEGVFTGILASALVWMLIPTFLPGCGFGYVWAVICGIIVGIASVIGDLTESHIKRGFNAKDSGDIMPGHGGLLDRTDSLIFGSVVSYALITIAPYLFNATGVFL